MQHPIAGPTYLDELNTAQRAAVEHTEGPTMIIAGAGSGKTRVLTYRLAHIIAQGLADPFELLALTFTNKAAKEMRERIARLIGPEARNIAMGTFHSIFSRILRIEAEHIGYNNNFSVYDDDDSMSLVKSIVRELKLDDKFYKPRSVLSRISGAKNYLIGPKQYAQSYAIDDFSEVVSKIYGIYQARLFQSNAMDFDDLLFNMVVLFERQPAALYKYQHRYKYILVDEYQDTNHAQYIITKKMAAVHENICVVGDDAQSIYSFRGANIENILSFQKDYPDVAVFKLEQNYRSTGVIVSIANEIIANNKNQLPKTVYTENETGELVRILSTASEQEEAQKVVDLIREQKMTNGFYNKDFALLYRTNAQSRALEDGLRRAGIVYKVFGGLSFYKRKEIKDMVAYMRLAINPADEEALKRVINYPGRGIGDVTMERILVLASEKGISQWEAMNLKDPSLSRSATALDEFALLIKSFRAIARKETAFDAVSYIAKHSGILKELHRDNTVEGLSRWENVQELINAAREFTDNSLNENHSLEAMLAEISLYTDQDQKIENNDFVTLMSIHAAKGLEFKSVFVVGLEEGLFPGMLATQSRADLEEERRLFYVAVTRAEKSLVLSHAKSRFRFGQLQYNEPSRFLAEIDSKYLKITPMARIQEDYRGPLRGRDTAGPALRHIPAYNPLQQTSMPDADFKGDDLAALTVGMRVEHNKFGTGVVVNMETSGGDRRANIDFGPRGMKTILLKYAKLKLLK